MAESNYGDRYYSRVPSYGSSVTAYTGAEGYADISIEDDDGLSDDSFSTRSTRISKPALSTRLLSSLPSQPAAAAALTRSKSILHSRAKSLAAWTSSFNNTPTSIAERASSTSATNRLFSDLFSGESAPVRLGIPPTSPLKEESELIMDYRPSLTQRTTMASRRRSVVSHAPQPALKQSWFTRKTAGLASAGVTIVAPVTVNDELLNLNINNALFPHGPADHSSPSDFNDLLINATRLLERMQSAYREKVEYITSIQPELDAQKEEVEESDTRAQHLKMQLEDMGRKAQEHETAMSQLAAQLVEEKARASEASRMLHDDTTPRVRKRSSAGSASDSGFESDWDRDTESVVSGGAPTPRTPPAVPASSPFDNLDQRLHDRHMRLHRQAPLRAINMGQGRTADDNAAAWNSVQQLTGENRELKKQVEVMLQTLQGCIEFVDNVHI